MNAAHQLVPNERDLMVTLNPGEVTRTTYTETLKPAPGTRLDPHMEYNLGGPAL